MVNESETEMEMVTLTQNENETLHWILMEILIWNADPHHQTLHLILSPQHHCQTVDYCLFHFRYPKNYYPLNQTF
jgi:hypothetical protein